MKNRFARYLIIALFAILSGCAKKPQNTASVPLVTNKRVELAPNSGIHADGNFDLKIIAGSKNNDLRIIADDFELARFKVFVDAHSLLHIGLESDPRHKTKHHPTVIVRTRDVTSLYFRGKGDVNAIGLHSNMESVVAQAQGQLNLQGTMSLHAINLAGNTIATIKTVNSDDLAIKLQDMAELELIGDVNIHSIDASGQSWLGLYWVNSPHMKVIAHGKARIELGGLADKVSAEIFDNAYYDGRYLRTQTAFVHTHNAARADLQVVDTQYALASDTSNIYYYHDPALNADYMAGLGVVLRMQNRQPPPPA